jgi:hypothetical protein
VAERMWFKGRAAMGLDAWYSGDVATNLENARTWLSDLPFDEMVGKLNLDFEGKDERLIAAGPDNPEFAFDYPLDHGRLQGPEFESVTRQGYLEAIGLALTHTPPVPIKTYWMTGAGNDEFEMHISDDREQVSVTLLVPDVEGGSEHPRSPESWVVTIDGDGNAQTRQTSGPPDQERPCMRGTTAS